MTDRTEDALDRLFRWCILAGNSANQTKRPEVRDAYHRAAARIGQEMLALGYHDPAKDKPRGE